MGQSCSAAVTSVLQDFTAVSAGHSLSEAMDFLSVQFLGLVSSLHCICLLLAIDNSSFRAAGRITGQDDSEV